MKMAKSILYTCNKRDNAAIKTPFNWSQLLQPFLGKEGTWLGCFRGKDADTSNIRHSQASTDETIKCDSAD